jgi:hypothetical protein
MTGGAQTWVHTSFPGAFFSSQGVLYVCVCGEAVEGKQRIDRKAPRTPPSYAHDSYLEVCGEGQGVLGDAVVPLQSAFLDGAENLTIPGVFHSMSKLGTFSTEGGAKRLSYGHMSARLLWPTSNMRGLLCD